MGKKDKNRDKQEREPKPEPKKEKKGGLLGRLFGSSKDDAPPATPGASDEEARTIVPEHRRGGSSRELDDSRSEELTIAPSGREEDDAVFEDSGEARTIPPFSPKL